MTLEPGHYWVQLASEPTDTWEVARRIGPGPKGKGEWTILHWDQYCKDDAFRIIDPRRLTRLP